ncbi:putative HTH-type transcriptional regulator [Nocardioides aquaticus]|uniref:HTH-type transcriptional regulator n=1 Tax=Nocardioides aquaticus TaxID=160826 RepID=A0ABX8EIM1_9ACTN|nr:TetR/AcrR family transcriptional regulator [Nocardioides aquaticus]QVT79735.1 putative HTH-type transcriptional regulator [Nocardioides aquaticus]
MTASSGSTASEAGQRPRVEGDREQEILDATLDVLADVGYDRLTMDAVASTARASKATLYRRWTSKAVLVIDALKSQKEPQTAPDTGTLRGDLLGMFCGMGGLTDQRQTTILASVITAIGRDQDFAEAFRRDFIGPKAELSLKVFTRARDRGEIRDDVDLDIVTAALPGIVLHRQFLLGETPDATAIERVVDQIILPAVAVGPTSHRTHEQKDS